MDSTRRTMLAIHEAGHATAAIVLDVPVARVSIRGREGRPGETTFNAAGQTRRVCGIIAVSGGVAERLLHECDEPVRFSETDALFIPADAEEVHALVEASLAILNEHRPLLEAVAVELLERGRLSGRELNVLVRDVSHPHA